jgi:hypothetical protein
MKRSIPGLARATQSDREPPDGVYLVRVKRVQYQRERQKPFYVVSFEVVEPRPFAGRTLSGRLYATVKALWKLSWFLKDFGYDPDLLDREELDEKALVGLTGVVKISHVIVNGRRFLNLEAFAPRERWKDLGPQYALADGDWEGAS